jgi:hypothetical protein
MKYLYAAVTCWLVCLAIVLYGCQTEPPKPFPEGQETYAPGGYPKHCIDYPNSIFCPQGGEE